MTDKHGAITTGMDDAAPSGATRLDDGAIPYVSPDKADISCIRCGYMLVGLDPRRPCPECGLLAGLSHLDGRELRHNRPRWLTLLSLGAALTALGFLTAPAWPAGVIALANAIEFRFAGPVATRTDWSIWALGAALAFAPGLLLPCGIWLLTRRAGRQRVDEAARTSRWALRLLALLPLLPAGVAALVGTGVLDLSPRRFVDAPVMWIVYVLVAAVLTGWLFVFLKGLAARAPAPLLAADSPVVGFVLGGSLVAWLIYAGVMWAIDDGTGAGGALQEFLLLFAVVWLAITATAYLWSIYLLVRYAVAFARTAGQARGLMREFDASRAGAAGAYDAAP